MSASLGILYCSMDCMILWKLINNLRILGSPSLIFWANNSEAAATIYRIIMIDYKAIILKIAFLMEEVITQMNGQGNSWIWVQFQVNGQINNKLSIAIKKLLLYLHWDLKLCVDVLKQILLLNQFHFYINFSGVFYRWRCTFLRGSRTQWIWTSLS